MGRAKRNPALIQSGKLGLDQAGGKPEEADWRFDEILSEMCGAYLSNGRPVEVDFRKLVSVGSGADRSTHLMHSYPAKLLPNIPIFFIKCSTLTPPNGTIYDPFCGTGTVLVEGLLAGHRVAGSDANPLARLIAGAKTTYLDFGRTSDHVLRTIELAGTARPSAFQPVVDVDKWFTAEAQVQLGQLRSAIEEIADPATKQLIQVAFSQTVKKVSLADPRMSVPVRYKGPERERVDPFATFKRIAIANAARAATLPPDSVPYFIGSDARVRPIVSTCSPLEADLVITSPPYAGAQKYIRASSLSLGWLGIVPEARLRTLEGLNIGREHLAASERANSSSFNFGAAGPTLRQIADINPLRANILRVYLEEMRDAAKASADSLKKGGHLVLVMGDNQVCGLPVRTSRFIKDFFEDEGLTLMCELVDTIKSRGLMTKRNRTAGIITQEHVFLFRK
ncbi:hypothetical protein [Hoeflea sp. BAL378]|uniref:hypothetical protein n=1 Tax=Hoeflea sp. BAL378 TaxID=1547437 RepID=UPI0009DF3B48|nr:hypothetical protein [Hoeflea sp. BAL378]